MARIAETSRRGPMHEGWKKPSERSLPPYRVGYPFLHVQDIPFAGWHSAAASYVTKTTTELAVAAGRNGGGRESNFLQTQQEARWLETTGVLPGESQLTIRIRYLPYEGVLG